MWTLLAASVAPERSERHVEVPERRNGAPVDPPAPGACAARNGTELRADVLVYLHPGGAAVGGMDVEQATAQFDLDAAPAFGSLAEAARACRGRNGFLVEVRRAADAGREGAPSAAVFFVEGLRP